MSGNLDDEKAKLRLNFRTGIIQAAFAPILYVL
jgi:hypothetical protein